MSPICFVARPLPSRGVLAWLATVPRIASLVSDSPRMPQQTYRSVSVAIVASATLLQAHMEWCADVFPQSAWLAVLVAGVSRHPMLLASISPRCASAELGTHTDGEFIPCCLAAGGRRTGVVPFGARPQALQRIPFGPLWWVGGTRRLQMIAKHDVGMCCRLALPLGFRRMCAASEASPTLARTFLHVQAAGEHPEPDRRGVPVRLS